MILRHINDLYKEMAKQDKENKKPFHNSTERKAFWISHYMQINLDIHLRISPLRNLHREFDLEKNCKFSHQITKHEQNWKLSVLVQLFSQPPGQSA